MLPRADSQVQEVEYLSGHLHRIYRIRLSDASCVLVKIPPPSWTPLLRRERSQLAAEAIVWELLADADLPVPRLVEHDPPRTDPDSSYLLITHLSGVPYRGIKSRMTGSERKGVERQLHPLKAMITNYASSTFGSVTLVADGQGFATWREAFTAMLESVLMDAEDILVALPYAEVREAVQRMDRPLAGVTEARLVVRGMGHEENVLIDKKSKKVTGLVGGGDAFWGDEEWARRGDEKGVL